MRHAVGKVAQRKGLYTSIERQSHRLVRQGDVLGTSCRADQGCLGHVQRTRGSRIHVVAHSTTGGVERTAADVGTVGHYDHVGSCVQVGCRGHARDGRHRVNACTTCNNLTNRTLHNATCGTQCDPCHLSIESNVSSRTSGQSQQFNISDVRL